MRNIFAIFLILAAIGIYYGFTRNLFTDIHEIKAQAAEYNDTIEKANQLFEERQVLADTVNSFNPADREKLDKMIPDNADNVRLILNIQNIAQSAGLSIKNIKVNESNTPAGPIADLASSEDNLEDTSLKYNSVSLSFTVTSVYPNFVGFVRKLEQSLRLVDITVLAVKPTDSPTIYNFDVTLKAYWLK